MADVTSLSESAQALFCAIADGVGKNNITNVLSLTKYPTYTDFAAGGWNNKTNRKRIDEASKYVTANVSIDDVEAFLLKDKGWYTSSVQIAKTLIESLHKVVDKDFKNLSAKGFLTGNKSMYYFRGDEKVMGTIQECFKVANKKNGELGSTMFGDLNKWSPADIYYANKGVQEKLDNQLKLANNSNVPYTFVDLNLFIANEIDQGNLLPLSLKKQVKSVTIEPVNFDIAAKDKVIDGAMKKNGQVDGGLWYRGKTGQSLWTKYKPLKRKHTSPFEPRTSQINNDAPARDIVMKISGDQGRADEKGKIQMRHDATTNSWKVDFSYTGAQARGGSIVSAKTFADLLDQVEKGLGEQFFVAFKTGVAEYKQLLSGGMDFKIDTGNGLTNFDFLLGLKGLKAHRKQIESDWQREIKNGTSIFGPKSKTNPYTNLRGEAAAISVMNRVGPILNGWLKSENANKIPDGMTSNKVDKFIRILFRYVTSQSESSAQFVIAK